MSALPNPMKYIKPKSIFAFVNRACHLRGARSLRLIAVSSGFATVYERRISAVFSAFRLQLGDDLLIVSRVGVVVSVMVSTGRNFFSFARQLRL